MVRNIFADLSDARNEWGIPIYLRRLQKQAKGATIAFVEVKAEYVKPEVYAETEHPYDYIWFTPATDLEDPCEKHKDQLKKLENADAGDEDSAKAAAPAAPVKKAPAPAKKKKSDSKKKQ